MTEKNYVPMLRWKRGEQNALAQTSAAHKAVTRPLITISGHSYDPPGGHGVDAAFDARITQDADRLRAAWAGYRASVDLGTLDPEAECSGGEHPLARFITALDGDVDVRPVVRTTSDIRYMDAIAKLALRPTLRFTPDDLADPDFEEIVKTILVGCSADANNCDVVIDLGYIQSSGAVVTARGALVGLPFIRDWETVTLAGGCFPENLSQYAVGSHRIKRIEWGVWRTVDNSAPRRLVYGDYATIHPIPVEEGLDPRTMNPSASVRYTYEDDWLLLRGEGTRNRGGRGFAQFQDHAENLVRAIEYRGPAFSAGDEKIDRIANKKEKPGNLETWLTIGVNHHIAEVVDQLAILP